MPPARDPITRGRRSTPAGPRGPRGNIEPKVIRLITPPPMAPMQPPRSGKMGVGRPAPKAHPEIFGSPLKNRGPLMRPAPSRPAAPAWRTRPTKGGRGGGFTLGKALSAVGEVASRPLHALAGAEKAYLHGQKQPGGAGLSPVKAFARGLAGKQRDDFGSVLKEAGVPKGKFRSTASAVGNFVGDPTNFAPPLKAGVAVGMVGKLTRNYPEELAVLKSIARNSRRDIQRSPKLSLDGPVTAHDVNSRTFTHRSGDTTGNVNLGPDPKRAKVGQLGTGFYAGHGYGGRHVPLHGRPHEGTSHAVKFDVKRPLNLHRGMDDKEAREFVVGANNYFGKKGEPLFHSSEPVNSAWDAYRRAANRIAETTQTATDEKRAWDKFLRHMEDEHGFDAYLAAQDTARGVGHRTGHDSPQIVVNNPKKVKRIAPSARHHSEYDAYLEAFHMGEPGATSVVRGGR